MTIATMPVSMEEASRFGIVIADENKKIQDFEEKPEKPRSNLASMGIYIFSWKVLRDALIELKDQQSCDFGKHIIPYCFKNNKRLFAYEFNGYWKDVGTLGSYWEANMELIDLIPEFNLYEEFWKIYTKCDTIETVHSTGGKSGALHYWGGSRDPWSGDQFGNRTKRIYWTGGLSCGIPLL